MNRTAAIASDLAHGIEGIAIGGGGGQIPFHLRKRGA